MTTLTHVSKVPAYALIIRATWEKGFNQRAALDEIHRRGLWLVRHQQVAAGFATQADYDADFRNWFDNRAVTR